MVETEPRAMFLELRRSRATGGAAEGITVLLGGGPTPEITWDRARCTECWACVAACPEGVRSFDESGPVLEPGKCAMCCACVDVCPSGALTCTARRWTVAELAHELLAAGPALREPGGGVTVTGSQGDLESVYVRELIERLRQAGIPSAVGARPQLGGTRK